MRSDLGNLLKALGRLEEAKVCHHGLAVIYRCVVCVFVVVVVFKIHTFFFILLLVSPQ